MGASRSPSSRSPTLPCSTRSTLCRCRVMTVSSMSFASAYSVSSSAVRPPRRPLSSLRIIRKETDSLSSSPAQPTAASSAWSSARPAARVHAPFRTCTMCRRAALRRASWTAALTALLSVRQSLRGTMIARYMCFSAFNVMPRLSAWHEDQRGRWLIRHPLRAFLDPEQHSTLHEEVNRLEHQNLERGPHQRRLSSRWRLRTHVQPRYPTIHRHQRERAPILEDEHTARRELLHAPAQRVRHEAQPVGWRGGHQHANAPRLPFRYHPARIPDLKTEQILEPAVAIETAAVVADLREPGP